MTRINTNVTSLIAQNTLGRSNKSLEQALTRLSTGLRINTGKDDPAGLIASENLRSDIASIRKAISNTDRANQVIATADSALGQVSSLLNDIRGLVTEAANSGAMSQAQIDANQLQIDQSLKALNRIAQTTTFQGRKLLDGSLDFITTAGAGYGTVSDLKIDQANLGSTGSISVSVEISAAATQALITNAIPAAAAATAATDTIAFDSTGEVVVTAATAGAAFEGVTVNFITDAAVTAGQAIATYDSANKQIDVRTNGNTTATVIASAINGLAEFTASANNGANDYVAGTDGTGVLGTLAGGADAVTGILAELTVEVSGATGSEVFTFEAGVDADAIVSAINLVSDAIGVEAVNNAGTVELRSTGYGSAAFVDVKVLEEGVGGTFETNLSASRAEGTDIGATVNGVTATGKGNTLTINTSSLDLTMTVADGSSASVAFTVDGGGALFQLGPAVVSNQQARIGITSLNTARLGGVNGKLFELGKGGAASLENDPNKAALIIEEAIDQVTSLRGRLGAFQRTLLETNKNALGDTLVNLTDAESQIRDADFAAETAALTRAQILVQSGTVVLQIANQNPQNVLALLQ
jgi:flagellin